MSRQTIQLDDRTHEWLCTTTLRETPLQERLRNAMDDHPEGEMQTSPEQVQFLALLIEAIGARRVIEVGVFTGYSALGMALGLPEDGSLIACDTSEEYMAVAQSWWDQAGVSNRIEPRVGPASETLDALISGGQSGTFDLAYIDADKTGYSGYYHQCLQLVRSGGLITFDNMLRGGRVADPTIDDASTVATRALVQELQADDRVAFSLLPIGDGLGLACPRGVSP